MDQLQDPAVVKQRIDSNLEQLANLSTSERTRSRKEILGELSSDLAEYYGYLPELIDLFLDLFSPSECVQYIEASERPRPLVIRTNTLKTTRKELMDNLTKRGASVEAVEWSKVAIKVTESSVPIGATPEYLAGHYMLQAASSLNPVMALAPQPGEKVLDMSSAPGGKTSYLAQLMKNSGFLVANDLKEVRQKATVANLHRLGVKCAVVCVHDGRHIAQTMRGFDRVLLDAPCSGMGIISRDPSVKLQRTVKDIERMAHLQKELLRTAIDVANVNGSIVYSTCSITVEENEMVVNYILQKRHVKLVESGLQVGKPGLTRYKERRFHPSLTLTRRFYPHVHNMDGFYVAKFVKLAHGERQGEDDKEEREDEDGEDGEDEDEDSEDDDEEEQEDEEADEDDEEDEEEEEEESEEEEEVVQPVVGKKRAAAAVSAPQTTSKPTPQPAPAKKEVPPPAKKEAAKPAPAPVPVPAPQVPPVSTKTEKASEKKEKKSAKPVAVQKVVEPEPEPMAVEADEPEEEHQGNQKDDEDDEEDFVPRLKKRRTSSIKSLRKMMQRRRSRDT